MSTWLYLNCLDHDPPLSAADESGQHLYDLPQIRADIRDREKVVFAYAASDFSDFGGYFRSHSAGFLTQHRKCRIGITDEYGQEYPTIEPVPAERTPNSESYLFNLEAVRDAVGEDFDDLDDEPAPGEPECDGRCLTAADIGLPEYGPSMYAVDPDCSFHGDDGTSKPAPEPEPEPVRHITTLAGNRVPVIDPYGRSWDAP